MSKKEGDTRSYYIATNELIDLNLEIVEHKEQTYLARFFKGQSALVFQESRPLLDSLVFFFQEQDELEQLIDAYKSRSQLERLSGNYKAALENYTRFKELSDTLLNTERDRKLAESAMQYEFDKKEAITRAEQEKSDQRQRLLRNSILAGLGFTLLFLVAWRQRNHISKE
jgi:hypothetical protein